MNNKLLKKLIEQYVSSWTVLICDVAVSTIASLIVLFTASLLNLNFGFRFSVWWIIGAALASTLMFIVLRTYCSVVRYSTFHDVGRICLAILGKDLLLFGSMALYLQFVDLNITIGQLAAMSAFDLFATIVCLLLVRIVIMMAFDALKKRYMDQHSKTRVLVYMGSHDDKSAALVGRLRNSLHYQIIGFISFGKGTHKMISGMPVFFFEDADSLEQTCVSCGINAVLFAHDDDVRLEKNRLIRFCQNTSFLKTLISPSIDEMVNGVSFAHSIRKIRIEDLLNRPEIKISMDEIRRNFNGKVIMVTGAAGSIGSELCRQLAGFGIKQLVMFDNAETPLHNVRLEFEHRFPELDFIPVIGDVRQTERLDYVFRKYKPQVVFHAAAYKHVPLMEENPCEAVMANVVGSRNVADKCVEYNIEAMVMISTDKAVNPTNIMGCTKRLAEIYVQSLSLAIERGQVNGVTRFVTTRFGNVLGSNGSVIPHFTEQIEHGGPVTVTHPDIERFFMTIPEACRLVMEAATFSKGNNIFVFDMGQPMKIKHLAEQMIKLAGYRPGIDINIEYCGLRPGEKLYEEVLADKENTQPTCHDRIRIAKVREYSYNDAAHALDSLEQLAREVNTEPMVRLMKDVVPEFVSNNSPYQRFDHTDAVGAPA